MRVIGVMFFLLAGYIVADVGYTVVAKSKPESSAAGFAVTAVSKRSKAKRTSSRVNRPLGFGRNAGD